MEKMVISHRHNHIFAKKVTYLDDLCYCLGKDVKGMVENVAFIFLKCFYL